MAKFCPACGSPNVRRSSFRRGGPSGWLGVLSPYRCRDCNAAFRSVSRNFWFASAAVAVGLAGTAVFFLVWAMLSGALSFVTELGR